MTITRRGWFAGAAAMVAGALTGCRAREDAGSLATQGDAALSPSGQFSALVASAADGLHPMIRRHDGEAVWVDDLGYEPQAFPVVTWEDSADVLWVLSSAHGNSVVRREGGDWVKSVDVEGGPGQIAELARRGSQVPPAASPRLLGPVSGPASSGRARAARPALGPAFSGSAAVRR